MLDEPMAGVNPALTQSLLGHVKDLREEGMTVLFVEHDMDMVRDISDWVIVMAQGQVIAEGPPDAVMGDQPVIDAYLGSHHDAALTEEDEQQVLAEAEEASNGSAPRTRRSREQAGRSRGERAPAPTSPAGPRAPRPTRASRRPRSAPTTPHHIAAQTHEISREDRTAHEAAAADALLRADELVAGYVPGVNILNGCDFYVQRRRAGRASSGPTAPASRPC